MSYFLHCIAFAALTAISLDNKGVFSEGFNAIQTKLDEKFYTSVQAFSEDMSAAFSSVINFAKITNVGEAEDQLSGVAHSSLTAEQKETKKLAKRIIKSIHPYFEDASRKESDLAGRPNDEKELPDLEALLDQRLRRRPDPPGAEEKVHATTETEDLHNEGDEAQAEQDADGDIELEDAKGNDGVQLAPTPEDNSADHRLETQDEADEAAIAAQFGQDALHASSNGDAMEVDHDEGDGPTSGAGTAPLTPPRSEKDLLAPLAHGGIPWYMEAFDPVGTTVHDEKWTGRDVLRDMSEELSELDDDALNGLADSDEVQPADVAAPGANVSDAHQKAARKQKKRSKGTYR